MNGDEGDPGAFMDRMMLESYPHRILEGIANRRLCRRRGRGVPLHPRRIPLAVQRVREAIRQAAARGYLGDRVLARTSA